MWSCEWYSEFSAILLLEPKAIDGVHKDEVLLFFLYDVLILKRFLVLDNRHLITLLRYKLQVESYKILPKGKLPQGNIFVFIRCHRIEMAFFIRCHRIKFKRITTCVSISFHCLFMIFWLAFVNLSVNEFSIIINREMQNNHTIRVFKHKKHTFNPFYCS